MPFVILHGRARPMLKTLDYNEKWFAATVRRVYNVCSVCNIRFFSSSSLFFCSFFHSLFVAFHFIRHNFIYLFYRIKLTKGRKEDLLVLTKHGTSHHITVVEFSIATNKIKYIHLEYSVCVWVCVEWIVKMHAAWKCNFIVSALVYLWCQSTISSLTILFYFIFSYIFGNVYGILRFRYYLIKLTFMKLIVLIGILFTLFFQLRLVMVIKMNEMWQLMRFLTFMAANHSGQFSYGSLDKAKLVYGFVFLWPQL